MKIVSKGHFKTIKQFKLLEEKKLGNGSFGIVKLAVHKSTNKLYAIKIINLQDVPSDIELKLIEREIKLHSQITHPHTIMLWDTIAQQQTIYMILEYAAHGNLFYYQNTKNLFKEPQAFLFFSQTLQALDNLHRNDIMHRDLKPENLLIDHYYNIKLCDFGWCAENINNKRTTFCGTYQYMAPEMLFNTSYDYRIDIWALGVLLYEMVHGYAPFKGDSVNQVKEKMLQGSYEIHENLSQSLKDLISGILKFDPHERLSLKQIRESVWFQSMQDIINQHTSEVNNYNPITFHQTICAIPPELYLHKSKKAEISKLEHSQSQTTMGKSYENVLKRKLAKESHNQTKNISFNFSINNFSYIKNSQRTNFNSPGQILGEKKKKKEQKRCRTQNEDELFFNLAQIHSPNSKKQIKTKIRQFPSSIKQQKQQVKSNNKIKNIPRKSQQPEKQRQAFRGGVQNSDFSDRTPSKISSIVKKKSVRQKLSTAVNSLKNIHKVKTKQKANMANSGYNY